MQSERNNALVAAGRFGGFFAIFLLLCSYSSQGARTHWKKQIYTKDTAINISANPKESIVVHYIGCSGFFISKGKDVLLFDPFFSYRSVFRRRLISGKKKISPKLKNTIDAVFNRAIGGKDINGVISALIIDHAHADHFGDVPYLFENDYLHRDLKIIGNTTTGHYVRGHDRTKAPNIVAGVEDSAASWLRGGRWIYVNSKVRVMPIVSEHGPHFKVLGKDMSFASGGHEMNDTKHRDPLCYGSGQTLSYIVDFLNDNGSVNFRIYHSSASMSAPNGFPPAAVLAKHGIDLAILCAASFNQVHKYPDEIIRYLRPRHIIFSHWEDFLLSSYAGTKKHKRKNIAYNYNKLFKQVNQTLHDLNDQTTNIRYSIPNIDTKMTFRY